MPYCDACEKYWTPSSMNVDGTCPRCGSDLDAPDHHHDDDDPAAEPTRDERAPWHFKLMVVALVVYLVWRFVELGFKLFT